MKARETAVLFFDGKAVAIEVIFGCGTVFSCAKEYAGIENGEFVDEAEFLSAVKYLFGVARLKERKITSVFVSIPAEFSAVAVQVASEEFSTAHRVTQGDIYDLTSHDEFSKSAEFVTIISSPATFSTEKFCDLPSALGVPAKKLSASMTYILCDRNKQDKIKAMMAEAGISRVEFVSSTFALPQVFVDVELRDAGALILDMGFSSSALIFAKSDGILGAQSIPFGIAHIAQFTAESLSITPECALNVLPLVSLSIVGNKESYYVSNGTEVVALSIYDVNRAVKKTLFDMAEYITVAINNLGATSCTAVHISGEILRIKGAVKVVAGCVGKDIMPVIMPNPMYSEAGDAERFAVIEHVKTIVKFRESQSFLSRLRRKVS